MSTKAPIAAALAAVFAFFVALPHRRATLPPDDGVTRVVVLGDSVARGAGDESGRGIAGVLDSLLTMPHEVINHGIDGARTHTVMARMNRFDALPHADVIVVSIGGNDLFGDSRARMLSLFAPRFAIGRGIARVETLVRRIRRRNAHARILLLGLYNPYRHSALSPWVDEHVAEWDAQLIAAFAGERDVAVLRIDDVLRAPETISKLDRFHPSARGYAAIAERIAYVTRSSG